MRMVALLAQIASQPLLLARTELDPSDRLEMFDHIEDLLKELRNEAIFGTK